MGRRRGRLGTDAQPAAQPAAAAAAGLGEGEGRARRGRAGAGAALPVAAGKTAGKGDFPLTINMFFFSS